MMHSKTTLITGAAQRVGAAIARHLAAQGHHLVLHYHRSETEAKTLADTLMREHGVTVTLVQADLATLTDPAPFWAGLPPVTHLIHNAARFTRDPFADFTSQDLRANLAINLEAPLLISQGFMAQLPTDTQGSISVLGDGSYSWSLSPDFFPYAVSKLAWESVISLLATACAPRVRVNLVQPGPTLSGALDNEVIYERIAAAAPLQRISAPQEVCAAIDYLLSAPGVTGQTLSLSGGFGLRTHRSSAS